MRMKRWLFSLAVIVAMASMLVVPAWSADAETQALLKEIQTLKARLAEMDVLKDKLAELENKVNKVETRQAEQVAAEKAADKASAEVSDETAPAESETAKNTALEIVKKLKIGGALRYNYGYSDFNSPQKDRGGDLDFDIFRLNVDGEYNGLLVSAEYRWYSYMNVIHHGWMGYNFTDNLQGQFGVTKVPFGLLPYASHNFWFGVPYYVGLEDDYDLGLKLIYKDGPLDLQFAFFKNAEWGNSSEDKRYSFDVINAGGPDSSNEEDNQFNLRVAYTFDHGNFGKTELGFSGEWGMLYNTITNDHGDHWAGAAHLNGFYGPFNLMLESAYYKYNPENPDGVSDDAIQMGAFADNFRVAAEGIIYVANLSYDLKVDLGPVKKLTFYDDFSLLDKKKGGGDNSEINTLGFMIDANPIYAYIDFIMGRNMIWLGHESDNPMADGKDDDWHLLFNVNVGYYF